MFTVHLADRAVKRLISFMNTYLTEAILRVSKEHIHTDPPTPEQLSPLEFHQPSFSPTPQDVDFSQPTRIITVNTTHANATATAKEKEEEEEEEEKVSFKQK